MIKFLLKLEKSFYLFMEGLFPPILKRQITLKEIIDKIFRLFMVMIIMYLFLYCSTFFRGLFSDNTNWLISLTSKNLRNLLLPILFFMILGANRFILLLLLLCLLSISSDIATVFQFKSLYSIFYYSMFFPMFFLGYEVYKYFREVIR